MDGLRPGAVPSYHRHPDIRLLNLRGTTLMNDSELQAELSRITAARHHDPFAVLGRHSDGDHHVVRAFIPRASEVRIGEGALPMARVANSEIFEWRGNGTPLPAHYSLWWRDEAHREHIARDPYTFGPQVGDQRL